MPRENHSGGISKEFAVPVPQEMPRAPHPSCVPCRTLSAASGLVGRGMPWGCPSHLRNRDSRWRSQEQGWAVLWGAAGREAPTNVSPVPIPVARPCRWQLGRSARCSRRGSLSQQDIKKQRLRKQGSARGEAVPAFIFSPQLTLSKHLQCQHMSPSSCCHRSLLVAPRSQWGPGAARRDRQRLGSPCPGAVGLLSVVAARPDNCLFLFSPQPTVTFSPSSSLLVLQSLDGGIFLGLSITFQIYSKFISQ